MASTLGRLEAKYVVKISVIDYLHLPLDLTTFFQGNLMSFTTQFREVIEPILSKSGFKLVRQQVVPFEVLAYERPNPFSSQPDRVTFHGDEERLHLYCEVVSGLRQDMFLKTLKELLPNFASLDYPEYNRWSYSSADELEMVLKDIGSLVETRLITWLQSPAQDPSSLSSEPKIALSRKDVCDRFAVTISVFENLAEQARRNGNYEESKHYEEAVGHYERQLLNITDEDGDIFGRT